MIQLLGAITAGVIYSIAGWKWRWMRSYLICPLIAIAILLTKGISVNIAYPILLMLAWNIGYGVNCPLQKLLVKMGHTDYNQNKYFIRLVNALAIAGCAIVLWNLPLFILNALYFVPLYTWITTRNPMPPRIEEFVVGFSSVLLPFYMIWFV